MYLYNMMSFVRALYARCCRRDGAPYRTMKNEYGHGRTIFILVIWPED